MSASELKKVATNLDMFMWRPLLSDPPMLTMRDLNEWVTIKDLLDAHEALDLKAAMQERASSK